ncbi:MAG: TlpA disulfide reductase family protein [Pseudomonadota bacterium]
MNAKPFIWIAAGLLIFSAGLYVIFTSTGNTDGANSLASADKGPSCKAAIERAKTLDPIAQGDMAAFRIIEDPLDVSNIAFVDADGNPKTLGDWKGKTVLFNLWATWCPPCREEMPYFETLQETKADETFQVVPVSIDLGDAAKPKAFYAETGLEALPFFHDKTMDAFQGLKKKAVALGMPTTLIVDPNGCALGVLNGPAHWASDDAIKLIDAAINL